MSQALRKLTGNLNKSRTIDDLHQPAAGEDRRDVRLAGDHAGRPGAEVLLVGPARHPPGRDPSRTAPRSIGNRARVKVVKNKVAPPFKQAEFDIMYGKGISREGSLLDVGVDLGIVKKSGAWFTYEGEQLGQGREKVKQFLAENLDLMVEISEKIRQQVIPDEEIEVTDVTGDTVVADGGAVVLDDEAADL